MKISAKKQSSLKGNPKSKNKLPHFFTNFFSVIFVFAVLVLLYGQVAGNSKKDTPISLSEVATLINSDTVKNIEVAGRDITIELTDGSFKKTRKEDESSLTETLKNYGVTSEHIVKTPITIKNESGFWFVVANVLPFLVPVLIIGFLIWSLTRSVKGAGMQAFSFGQSKAKMTNPSDTKHKITFANVAGAKEAKQELEEIVDFLKNPQKFLDIGARIPKGVLLTGAPGTGKTMLARAVAGEANVPFFYLSGSEFVEMFVGVGASRVRDLFQQAKKASPAIVFIDEIDAVGRVRGHGMGGGNDEREQTLNQILVEMDGFEPTEKVIVMAATNRSDVLDPALLRPGRFDRRVVLDLPDRNDREAILLVHSKEKPLDADVNLRVIAERTPGFSGADLFSLMNEGAIVAARANRKKVKQSDLIQSIEKVMLGPERKSHLMSIKEKEITAYHEAGRHQDFLERICFHS
jgi:cell division protease FtsH